MCVFEAFCAFLMLPVFSSEAAMTVIRRPNITTFRQVGFIADGVVHAHVIVDVDINDETNILTELGEAASAIAGNATSGPWKELVNDVISLQEEWQAAAQLFAPPKREKRQVFVAAAIGGAAVAAAASGIFALFETNKLRSQVGHLSGRVSAQASREKQIQLSMQHIIKAVNSNAATTGDELRLSRAQAAAAATLRRSSDKLSGVYTLLQHKLSPKLVPASRLLRIFNMLGRRVSNAGYQLLMEGPAQLFGADVSYSSNGTAITAYVHAPAAPAGTKTKMRLFEHKPIPVLGNNNTYFWVTADKQYLAVDEDNKFFVQLSAEELEECSRSNFDVLCPLVFPRLEGGTSACLPALFNGQEEVIRSTCNAIEAKKSTFMLGFNSTAILVFSATTTTVSTSCPNGDATEVEHFQGTALVDVAHGCTAAVEEFFFKAVKGHPPADLHEIVKLPQGDMSWATIPKMATVAPTNDTTSTLTPYEDWSGPSVMLIAGILLVGALLSIAMTMVIVRRRVAKWAHHQIRLEMQTRERALRAVLKRRFGAESSLEDILKLPLDYPVPTPQDQPRLDDTADDIEMEQLREAEQPLSDNDIVLRLI
jgi:hypothetical protein